MKTLIALGVATVGGVIAFRCLPRESRDRLAARVGHWMTEGMEHMIASLPEGTPPKLVLREQNELLREHQRTAH